MPKDNNDPFAEFAVDPFAEFEIGPSQTEAAIEGVKEGVSLGFLDELGGHMEAMGSKFGIRGLGSSDLTDIRFESDDEDKLSYGEVYEQARDIRRQKQQEAREAHPGTFLASDLAGSVIMPGGAAVGSLKGATKAAKVAQGMKIGAGVGAVEGAGRSDEDVSSPEFFKDVALGTGIGAASGAFFPAFAKGTKAAGKTVQKGKEFALDFVPDIPSSVGFESTKAMRKELMKPGAREKIVKDILEAEEFLGEKIVKGNVNDVAKAARKYQKKVGDELEKLSKSLDETFVFEGPDLKDRILGELDDAIADGAYDEIVDRKLIKRVKDYAQEIGSGKDLKYSQLHKMRQRFDDKAYRKGKELKSGEAERIVRRALQNEIHSHAGVLAEWLPNVAKEPLDQLNKRYSFATKLIDATENQATKGTFGSEGLDSFTFGTALYDPLAGLGAWGLQKGKSLAKEHPGFSRMVRRLIEKEKK